MTNQDLSDRALEFVNNYGSGAEAEVRLGQFCTYKVGGAARAFVEAQEVEDLEKIAQLTKALELEVLVVGKGSNLLVADAGFDGVAVKLGSGFAEISADQASIDYSVLVGAAAMLPVVARKTASLALSGFEWAVGVPGSIGGAVRMNAGGHGSDMAQSVSEVSVIDLSDGGTADSGSSLLRRLASSELDFAYRSSSISQSQVVVSVKLDLVPGDQTKSESKISEIVKWRRQNQPGGQNAGSVFANPDGDSSGRIIESLGLKGFSLGTASVSDKHANFIQAEPDGSADDVYSLIKYVREKVALETGVELRVENRLIGDFEQRKPN